jgi:hypothetical protein
MGATPELHDHHRKRVHIDRGPIGPSAWETARAA